MSGRSFRQTLFTVVVLCIAYFLWTKVPYNRAYFVYLLGSYLIGFLVIRSRGEDPRQMFSKSVWFHETSRNEAYLIIITFLSWSLIISNVAVFSSVPFSNFLHMVFHKFDLPALTTTPSVLSGVIYIVASVFAYEASYYFSHRLLHGSKTLWEFHKVHHSAQVMTPFTSLRQHPVELMFNTLVSAVFIGSVSAVFFYFYPSVPSLIVIVDSNVVLATFFLLGGSLAHSHVWLSWGRLNRYIISPAMHQIHHSDNPRHFDKNFGLMLTCFDRWFGTAYLPEEKEDLVFGLGEQEDQKFVDLKGALVAPFVRAITRD